MGFHVLGNSLMHTAVMSGNFAVIQFLAKRCIDVNQRNTKGSTVLHSFLFSLPSHGKISDEQMDVLKVLLKSGADPTVVEECSGLTPLHFAVQRDHAVLECLLSATDHSNLPRFVQFCKFDFQNYRWT